MNHLIVIGNGFDKSLGFATSYIDFMRGSRDLRARIEHHSFSQINSIFKNLSDFQPQTWVDLEAELGTMAGAEDIEFQRDDFDKLVEMLNDYLKSLDYGKLDSMSHAYKFFAALYNKEDYFYIVNFNYTDTISRVLHSIVGPGHIGNVDIINVHGSLEAGNIILGVNDSIDLPRDLIFLRKAYTKGFVRTNWSRVLNAEHRVYFFGHSLGETDHTRIKPIFDSIMMDPGGIRNFYITYHGEADYHSKHYNLDLLTGKNLTEFKSNCLFQAIDTANADIDFHQILA